MKKSTSPDNTGTNGIMILGKYTFVNILEVLSKLVVDLFRDPEK